MAENSIQNPRFPEGNNGVNQQQLDKRDVFRSSLEEKKLENDAEKGRRGWVGRIWGDGNNSAVNIAGILIVLLVVIGAGYTFWMLSVGWQESHSQVLDFWKVIVPLITLALGYLFGKRQQ